MKKAIYTSIIILFAASVFTSCKKEYHCSCTYNNTLMYSKDLGNQSLKDAKSMCSDYDSTVAGEVWNCTVN